jgi:hypothetical protein
MSGLYLFRSDHNVTGSRLKVKVGYESESKQEQATVPGWAVPNHPIPRRECGRFSIPDAGGAQIRALPRPSKPRFPA